MRWLSSFVVVIGASWLASLGCGDDSDSEISGEGGADAAAESGANYISSDCELAGHHIEEGIARLEGNTAKPELRHPITLLRIAYGIPD